VAGEFGRPVYEESYCQAFERVGHVVKRVRWRPLFGRGLSGRAQYRLQLGPSVRRINRELLAAARAFRPDAILVWRGIFVWPETLDVLRNLPDRPLLLSYNNDDPFGDLKRDPLWRHHIRGLSRYDVCFVYRHQNVAEYLAAGAPRAHLLRAHFDPSLHHPLVVSEAARQQYQSDVAFVGHYDGRDTRVVSISRLANAGIPVRVYGHIRRSSWLDRLIDLALVTGRAQWPEHVVRRMTGVEFRPPVEGPQYTEALNAITLPLSFLSVGNRDTYTRRCFEIPACGKPLVSVRTGDLQSLFEEDREAVFFDNPDELLSKVRWLLADAPARERIARAGYERVYRDGHDIDSRAAEMLRVAFSVSSGDRARLAGRN
jgi:spore maturation protein CgeB